MKWYEYILAWILAYFIMVSVMIPIHLMNGLIEQTWTWVWEWNLFSRVVSGIYMFVFCPIILTCSLSKV